MLMIACGAIANELVAIKKLNRWQALKIECLPAELHNTPGRIPDAVRKKLAQAREAHEAIFVAYADCGTAGKLDAVLDEFDVQRLPGAHCYEFFASGDVFSTLCQEQIGSFFLTDFLVRHFERLVWRGLGLDRYPDLLKTYFGNYRRLVYLAQTDDPALQRLARQYADQLGLEFKLHFTGLTPLKKALPQQVVLHEAAVRPDPATPVQEESRQ